MPKSLPKILGTPAERDHRIPLCSRCERKTQRNDLGEWFCRYCMNEHLRRQYGPEADFAHLLPNREARRRARRG